MLSLGLSEVAGGMHLRQSCCRAHSRKYPDSVPVCVHDLILPSGGFPIHAYVHPDLSPDQLHSLPTQKNN